MYFIMVPRTPKAIQDEMKTGDLIDEVSLLLSIPS